MLREEFMTKGAMLELLTAALDRYESSYRHPAQQKYVRGDLYALYPEGKKMVGECELCWPDDSWPNSKKTGVYAIFGETGRLLYVGRADFLGDRLADYFTSGVDKRCVIRHSGWTEMPMYVATVAVPDETGFEAYALETYLIRTLDPVDNTVGRLRASTIAP